jgi:hypothetical protein
MMRLFLKMLADDVHPAWAASRRMPAYPVDRDERPPASGESRPRRALGERVPKAGHAQFDSMLRG